MFFYNKAGNKFTCQGRLYNSKIIHTGSQCVIKIAKGVIIKNTIISISGNRHTLIINEGVHFEEGGKIKIEDEDNNVVIGKDTSIINAFIAASDYNSNIIIGEKCLISNNVVLRNSDVHSIINIYGERINHAKDTIIGNHVWIGYGATILKGVRIGENTVIGTQTVISGTKIPKGSIVAGNPGIIIKENINWCSNRIK